MELGGARLSQLLGEGNAAGDLNSPIRAAVRATLNAALLHLQTDFQSKPAWEEVAERSKQHPVAEIREWLGFRAETFLARNIDGWRALAIRLKSVAWNEERRRQAAVGLFARVYESGMRIDRRTGDWPVFDEADAAELAPLPYLAFRAAPVYTVDLPQPVQRWADWRIPDCLTDRVRLEMVVTLPRDAWSHFALEWAQTAAGRLDNIDSERLLSALLAGPVLHDAPVELMVRMTGAKYYDPAREPNCPVHNATKPLYYALALELKRRGDRERATEILGTVRQIMLETRQRSPELEELGTLLAAREATAPAAAPKQKFGWSGTLGALLGLAMLGGIVYGLYRATRWTMASEKRIATAVTIAICAALARLLRNRAIRVFAALWRPKLIVTDTGDRIQIAYTRRGPWPPTESLGRDVFQVNRPGRDGYRAQARGMRDVCSRLRSLTTPLLGGRVQFELKLPPALQGVPWEALNLGIGGDLANPREYVQFARTAAPVETGSAHRTSERSVALIARSAQMTLLWRAWAATEHLFTFTERGLTTAREQATASRVIHLVGRTRRSGSERTFQITADQYFTVREITTNGPAVVIVQAEPVESLVRTDTDREECAALRAFAAQLFEGGVGTVILLPQMPAATAETVVRKVAAFSRRRGQPGYFAWLNHVSDLRNSIAKSITAASIVLTEAAQQYTHAESAAGSVRVDVATLNTAREEMSMDVTLWTRIS
jgi:hypothetical protein